MRIVFLGTPDFAVPSLKRLIQDGHEIVGVYTQPDKPKNRGMKLTPSPVKVVALEHNLPVFQPKTLKDEAVQQELKALAPELMVVAAYGKILPQAILDIPAVGCINVHSSLLPKYRGAAPINWAILNGESETGVTIMHVVAALDAGDIILQAATPIDLNESVEQLHDRLAVMGRNCWGRRLRSWQRELRRGFPRMRASTPMPPCSAGSCRPSTGPVLRWKYTTRFAGWCLGPPLQWS